jgi:hypothetical protein
MLGTRRRNWSNTRAQFLHGEWTATSFSGTTSNYSPSAGGCVTSTSKSSMNGRRL